MTYVVKVSFIFCTFVTFSCGSDLHNDASCDSQLSYFDSAFERRESWALNMLDTWGRTPSGLLHGNTQSPGHYTECVEFRHNDIQGQHCMLTVTAAVNSSNVRRDWTNPESNIRDYNLTPIIGICLPASCSVNKIIDYSNKFLIEDGLEGVSAICRTNDAVPFQTIDYFAIIIFSLLFAALVASTIYEVVLLNNGRDPNKLLAAFSLYTNGAKLFAMKETSSPNVINCLNGLRTLSIFWIIFGHRFDDRDYVPVFNDSSTYYKKYIYLIFTNYDKPVDTFFVMGGLLVTSSLLNSLDRKNVNIPRMYLHRYLRYTPSLALIILFHVSFTKFLGAGPFFNAYTENCEKYWWSALLHLTVYTNPLYPCYDVSWYLSVDFQLFLISPIIIYPIWKWGRKAFWILPVIVLLVQGCIFTTTYTKGINVYFFQMTTLEGIFAWLEKFYFPTHLRLGSWVIGIMLGFVLHHEKGNKLKISKFVSATLWVISIAVLLTILLCHYPFIQLDDNRSILANAFYNACYRIGWSYSVAWIIYACHNGSGGVIRWFLSWKEWQPLGKLGLNIYLVHRLYQIITVINQQQPIVWDFFTQTQKFFGDVVVSTILATILYLIIENPVSLIESYLYDKIKGCKLYQMLFTDILRFLAMVVKS
ncbi:nose resistant to fluoxetine protein 6-like [Bradysia coprophila]|uniref:nose resistant to fluoxetine protein 6-like n=1 Tax=Bradysia coprophila TaxID=38358 RepID=UPI00187DB012|nr:nose resistant to fluoxetine protein 6-like [Bradysia coprophila]